MKKFENCYRKFIKYIYNHASNFKGNPNVDCCLNEKCKEKNDGKDCVFNNMCNIYNSLKYIICPHYLIDILVKYCNYNKTKIIDMKYMLYVGQVNFKKSLMDLIFEKSKRTKRKDNLTILYRKIRSSKSCCISYYFLYVMNMVFVHINIKFCVIYLLNMKVK